MKQYFVEHGTLAGRIFVDDESNNTEVSVEDSLLIEDSLDFKSVIIVS